VSLELELGEAAVRAARALHDIGLYNDALSRLYYATLHHAVALLLTAGVQPRRHRAVAGLLSTHFLGAGALTAEDIALLGRVASDRALADYERAGRATAAIVEARLAEVEPLIARIRACLAARGFLP